MFRKLKKNNGGRSKTLGHDTNLNYGSFINILELLATLKGKKTSF
jgi:biopolymer transport protein ExbD